MEPQRLDKLLSGTGRWSRREVKLLVKQGRVLADGRPAPSADAKYDPETVRLTVDGETLCLRAHTWVMMNKPAGVLSATEDGRGRTVLDLLPPELQGVYGPILRQSDPELHALVKAADKLSAYIKCVEELKAGNGEFRDAAVQTRAALEAMAMPEVDYFLETFMDSFFLTLDELK